MRDELERLAADGPVELVPLLFAPGFHSDVDVPGVLDSVRAAVPGAQLHVGPSLGSGTETVEALVDRLEEAGLPAGQPDAAVLVVAVGKTIAGEVAPRLAAAGGWAVSPTTVDDLAADIAQLRAAGLMTIAVSSALLAPGVFADRIAAASAGADVVAAPIGAHPALIRLITERATS